MLQPLLPQAPVVVIGAASIDIKAHSFAPAVPATSNPGEIRLSLGGVARNIAENLARLGVATTLCSAVGDDGFGREILARTAAAGVDTTPVLRLAARRTATYLALLHNDSGDMAVSIDDMGICAEMTPAYIRRQAHLLSRARLIVLDANLSPAALKMTLGLARRAGVGVCIDPVSVALSSRLRPNLCDYTIITPNTQEAEALCGDGRRISNLEDAARAAQQLRACGVRIVVITLGPEGLFYAAETGAGHIPAPNCAVVDATGAGDGLTAGVVYGLLNGMELDEAMRIGASVAALTLASAETVNPELSLERVYEQMTI